MPANLTGKTAVITGASRGLGYSIAETFWRQGANLILIARDREALQNFVATHPANDQTIEIIATDLGRHLQDCLAQLADKKIDILVNNAAISGPIGPLWENNWDDWLYALEVNMVTPISLARALISGMIARNSGKIINLSGGGATTSRPNFSAYAIAKTGLVRFTEILADELKPYKIDVNAIAPGVMNTHLLTDIIQAGKEIVGEKEYSQAYDKIQSEQTMTENPAELCLFLASEASDGITGKLISATWDPWKSLIQYKDTLKNTDIYTLRRIVPKDRGQHWE
jgi:3-oxoacyl-[acyl-carrier protein] reductase